MTYNPNNPIIENSLIPLFDFISFKQQEKPENLTPSSHIDFC